MQKEFTFHRFLYLNIYGFLLTFGGIAILLLPLHGISWICTVIQVVAFLLFEKNAIRLFSSWKDKKRKYAILMEKNATEFHPNSFKEYMQAPCGRLLTRVVLKDLNISDKYPQLKLLKKPLKQRISEGCKPKKTVIYIKNEQS